MKNAVFAAIEKQEKIHTGASGAELFVITADGKEYVLKTANPKGRHLEEYKKEFAFYALNLGFGININSDALLDHYCEKLSGYKGIPIEKSILLKERHAATLLNIFSFWAYHLKNCKRERVAAQFDEMVKAYHYLVRN